MNSKHAGLITLFLLLIGGIWYYNKIYNAEQIICYKDFDRDGHGSKEAKSVKGNTCPLGWVSNNNDTNDNNANRGPGEKTWYLDGDRDGFGDKNSTIIGLKPPTGYVNNGRDIDDNNKNCNPSNSSECNSFDIAISKYQAPESICQGESFDITAEIINFGLEKRNVQILWFSDENSSTADITKDIELDVGAIRYESFSIDKLTKTSTTKLYIPGFINEVNKDNNTKKERIKLITFSQCKNEFKPIVLLPPGNVQILENKTSLIELTYFVNNKKKVKKFPSKSKNKTISLPKGATNISQKWVVVPNQVEVLTQRSSELRRLNNTELINIERDFLRNNLNLFSPQTPN